MENIDLSLVPQRVADVLAADIIFGRLAPESRIIEEDVAARFGVSRSPVRESIRLLERDGLVIRAERRGARVSPLSRRDLDEVYICRLALEGIAAAEAATHRTEEDLVKLQLGLSRLRAAFKRADIADYFEANVAFTTAIHDSAGNLTLKRLLAAIGKQALRYRYLAYKQFPELISASVEGNERVLIAIESGDKTGARRQTEALIQQSWDAIHALAPEES